MDVRKLRLTLILCLFFWIASNSTLSFAGAGWTTKPLPGGLLKEIRMVNGFIAQDGRLLVSLYGGQKLAILTPTKTTYKEHFITINNPIEPRLNLLGGGMVLANDGDLLMASNSQVLSLPTNKVKIETLMPITLPGYVLIAQAKDGSIYGIDLQFAGSSSEGLKLWHSTSHKGTQGIVLALPESFKGQSFVADIGMQGTRFYALYINNYSLSLVIYSAGLSTIEYNRHVTPWTGTVVDGLASRVWFVDNKPVVRCGRKILCSKASKFNVVLNDERLEGNLVTLDKRDNSLYVLNSEDGSILRKTLDLS